MKIPDEFELPRPEDFCRCTYFLGQQACAAGWLMKLFDLEHPGQQFRGGSAFQAAYLSAATDEGREELSITCANDEATPEQRARFFEAGIRAMGYEIT